MNLIPLRTASALLVLATFPAQAHKDCNGVNQTFLTQDEICPETAPVVASVLTGGLTTGTAVVGIVTAVALIAAIADDSASGTTSTSTTGTR